MSANPSSSFELLDERIRRWIWAEGWTELRDAQERAIPAILPGDRDVIIAAATAAGKTEAAFLPILTRMLEDGEDIGVTIYISPLKALINDQFGRLELLCENLEIPVWPWHGDISSSLKNRFLKRPAGVLLITPESLEALLCNRGFNVPQLFTSLRYIVVDELHAFIGTERGKQLQSLMQRVEAAIGIAVPRVGLSATLGDMRLAGDFLRPCSSRTVEIIESKSDGGELLVSVKGYIDTEKNDAEEEGEQDTAGTSIAAHLFKLLRGSNNLVFPNSRRNVEYYTYRLQKLCEAANVPNEFWPHHGSLSKEIREEAEAALKDRERHTTAVCTNTLELGIDIGAVKSIAQIGPPPSVASLRQRLGRSGRREGEPAILRGYVTEWELTAKSHPMTQLRNDLFEFCAMVSLLMERWFEPPKTDGLHMSTLVQQVLALIAQRGGVAAPEAYKLLCSSGPFAAVEKADFAELLRHLGLKELIQQDSSGVLLHGAKGEPMVSHYTFYAAFASDDEFRVVSGSKTLGSLPISSAVSVGDFILFAAKTWRVEEIDDDSKTIYVSRHVTGRPPSFDGGGGLVHDRVRQRMRELYESDIPLRYLDKTAAQLLEEGRQTYRRYSLGSRILVPNGNSLILFTWLGDRANEAIAAMLRRRGLTPMLTGPAIEIMGHLAEADRVTDILRGLGEEEAPSPEKLLCGTYNLRQEKWDWALPDGLLMRSFASLRLDIPTAHAWLRKNSRKSAPE
jgi:ATP-dependent helicase Lhr and Lhr-like helicase